jgi:C4-dicarboxylate-specific signal transduction histidine kinase
VGDVDHLHQVVINLVSNAVYALRGTPEPRRLAIETRAGGTADWIVLQVTDSGPGVPPEIKGLIFEPFFTTRPAGEGGWGSLSLIPEKRGILNGRRRRGRGRLPEPASVG